MSPRGYEIEFFDGTTMHGRGNPFKSLFVFVLLVNAEFGFLKLEWQNLVIKPIKIGRLTLRFDKERRHPGLERVAEI